MKTFELSETHKDLYVMGDIHGEFGDFFFDTLTRYRIEGATIVIAGDVGVGFEKPGYYDRVYSKYGPRLEKAQVQVLCLRGNHDDPEYFGGSLTLDYPLLKCLPDYTVLQDPDGRKVLLVGGAISIDRESRKESRKTVWWPGEAPEYLDEEGLLGLPGNGIDCVISHEAPISFPPILTRPGQDTTGELWKDILGSREYLDKVLWRTRPARWYYGHHHSSWSGTNGVTMYRGLGIKEIAPVFPTTSLRVYEDNETEANV